MPSYRKGDQLGRWSLVTNIGRGGNGDVWQVEDADGEIAALKILRSESKEGYSRFRREVEICEQRDPDEIAILPVLDSHLPDKPTADDRPWFSMPLATGLADALAGRPLVERVAAVRDVSSTLARLLAEDRINHRDVKPENLYIFRGRAVVGDFGLAKRPDDPDLTGDKPIGAFHHYPSEVIASDEEPDWERVDVHCLGNSLWRLALERPYPPRGPIPANGEYGLGRLLDERGAQPLAELIEGATVERPGSRPTLGELANQLDEWISAQEIDDDYAAEYERGERAKLNVLRWVVTWVRDEPNFGTFMYALTNPAEASDVDGLTHDQVVRALAELIEDGDVTGETHGRMGRTGPAHITRIYPTIHGLSRVESIDVLTAQAAPLLRAFAREPVVVSLPRTAEPIDIHSVQRTPAEAYFQMRLLSGLGLLDYRPAPESGGGAMFIDVHATGRGKRWLYERGG